MIALLVPILLVAAADDIPYGVAPSPWPESLGNHRVRIRVASGGDFVIAAIPWRRRDPAPETKDVIIIDAATGKAVANRVILEITRERGTIAFEPPTVPGEYFVHYLPYEASRVPHQYATRYVAPRATADPAWLARVPREPGGAHRAEILEFQARSEFDRLDPMEVTATAEETRALIESHSDRPVLLFPEDRRFPIRMARVLPLRWIRRGPSDRFEGGRDRPERRDLRRHRPDRQMPQLEGEAQPGEYYVFQIGVFAARAAAEDLAIDFGELRGPGDARIPSGAFRCFNLGGVDWLGRRFTKSAHVGRGEVGALWIGIDVPEACVAGRYEGPLEIRMRDLAPMRVAMALRVSGETMPDRGDRDLWRLSRLRWLDSTIGIDDEVTAPYTPLAVDGATIACLGRTVRFGESALPDSIRSGSREILAAPIAFIIETGAGPAAASGAARNARTSKGAVEWEASGASGAARIRTSAVMDYDGYIDVKIDIVADEAIDTKDMRLEIPLRRDIATYMMGLGRKGGIRPREWRWSWDIDRANHAVWIGDVDAGLHLKLKDPDDAWNLYTLRSTGLPDAWANGGAGGCAVIEEGDRVVVRAFTSPRRLEEGRALAFRFGLLPTPVKPLDSKHFGERYYHDLVPVETAKKAGATIINIHHGNSLNPYINYPFRTVDRLAGFARDAHAQGMRVKIYYTVRELSNRVAEMFALRSLGQEIFTGGPGGGHSWLCEHLVSDYAPAWHHTFPDGEVDAAIATAGLSRWHNYYLEGLAWLLREAEIDGLYLDGIGYNRAIMKRVRKVLDRVRPGSLIDFHSGNNFDPAYGLSNCANQYLEHFPYIDSLWFGEGFDYNESPDYWLVEISGIPFGLFGEMLQGGGHPWRGMLYGMSNRFYQGADPNPIWGLWDLFGIGDAAMIGYWDSACPVRTDSREVLATVYRRERKALVALASWAKEPSRVRLAIDWKALGIDAKRASLYTPPVRAHQPARLFKPDDPIPVAAGRGWWLIIDEETHEIPVPPDPRAGRKVLLDDAFAGDRLGAEWTIVRSKRAGTNLGVADGRLAIESTANSCAFAERALPAGVAMVECRVGSGTDRGATWGPGVALIWPAGALRINLRAEGRFGVDIGGHQVFGGFVEPDAWYLLRIRVEPAEIVAEASADGVLWETIHTIPRGALAGDPVRIRIGKMSGAASDDDFHDPGPAGTCAIDDVRIYDARGNGRCP